jgi:hypothetical protein
LQRRPQLHIFSADARPFLRTTRHRYDLIAVDAYRQPYIPFLPVYPRVLRNSPTAPHTGRRYPRQRRTTTWPNRPLNGS